MNKQLTKKTIGIAASAALMASLAASGSALAAPGNGNGPNKQGPQGSIGVMNTCEVDDSNIYDVLLIVTTTITDKSSGDGVATIIQDGFTVQAMQKFGGRYLFEVGDAQMSTPTLPEDGSVEFQSTIHLCQDGVEFEGLDPLAKAANAETTVMIDDGHKVEGWISRCIDDPDTAEDEQVTLKLDRGLCPQNAD